MFIEILLSNFEIIAFFSVLLIVIGFFSLFMYQSYKFNQNRDMIISFFEIINKSNNDSNNYLANIANILELQKNEILKMTEKISFIEREITRLGNIKGSEDALSIAIDMARKGESKESIRSKTNLRDDEIEAIYTYYRK
ncbi:MAG: hypothetical protein ISQ83_04295 [Alphaproteobacteria bacterium]|jgi:hypothetical protein|nr:hypothetical protein [Alphaproteobacteria bacterium]